MNDFSAIKNIFGDGIFPHYSTYYASDWLGRETDGFIIRHDLSGFWIWTGAGMSKQEAFNKLYAFVSKRCV